MNGIGGFTENLLPYTKYYQKYKSKNCCFDCLSNIDSIITSPPSVSSENISNISYNKVRFNYNISNYENFFIAFKGVQYSTSSNNLFFTDGLYNSSPNVILSNTNTGNTIIENEFNLEPNTTYYMRPYIRYNSFTGPTTFGKIISFKTLSICDVGNLSTQRDLANKWLFSFKLNPNANKYNLRVCYYKESNINSPPSDISLPVGCYTPNSMTNYYPTAQEISSKQIQKLMSPQPNVSNRWYSIEVKSISPNCPLNQSGTKHYFYNNIFSE